MGTSRATPCQRCQRCRSASPSPPMIQTKRRPGMACRSTDSVSTVARVPQCASGAQTCSFGWQARSRAVANRLDRGAGARFFNGLPGDTNHQTASSCSRFKAVRLPKHGLHVGDQTCRRIPRSSAPVATRANRAVPAQGQQRSAGQMSWSVPTFPIDGFMAQSLMMRTPSCSRHALVALIWALLQSLPTAAEANSSRLDVDSPSANAVAM